MNNLSALNISSVYDTDENVKKFYNEVLSNAKIYKRVSAYFNNGIFKYISKGLSNLLKNDGKMQLILSSQVDNITFENIKKGYALQSNKDEYIIQNMRNNNIDLENIKDDISILSFLIAINRLEVKMAFRPRGIFHDKYAIISDDSGNTLVFSGSNNETEAAIEFNHESFETTLSWNNPSEHEKDKIVKREQAFEDIWNNNKENLVVLPIPEIVQANLIGNINYNEIEQFAKNLKFIRVTLDGEYIIRIQTNFSIEILINQYSFKDIHSLINFNESTSNLVKLEKFDLIKDYILFKDIIESTAKKINVKLFFSSSFNKFIERYYIDFPELSKLGSKIKDKDLIMKNPEFISFRQNTNSLLKRDLREAQSIATYHIVKLRRTMNFSVPGSGKTASVLAAFEYLNSLDENNINFVDKLLVIGPINCFKSWQDEYALVSRKYNKYSESDIINIKNFKGTADKDTIIKYDFPKARLVLINFEAVTSMEDILSKYVSSKTFVVFDEIHRIKKIDSFKYLACKHIIQKTNYRVALTGTPLPNGYEDLLNIFNLLYDTFSQTYFRMYIEDLKSANKQYDENGIEFESLNKLMFPFYVRVTKKDLHIPKANKDNLIIVPTTSEEERLYFHTIDTCLNHFEASVKLTEIGCLPEEVSRKLTSEETNCFTGYNENEDINLDFSQNTTSKINAFISLLLTNNRKSLVWCIFIKTINTLYKILLEKGIKVARIYGSTPLNERNIIIDEFNNGNSIQVLLTNPHTLAESVSLHKSCHDAYYIELNYNLAQYLQSKDRIHRLGLPENTITNYYFFINKYGDNIEDSIDYKIYKRLCKKEKKMQNAIEEGKFFVKDEYNEKEIDRMIEDIRSRRKQK